MADLSQLTDEQLNQLAQSRGIKMPQNQPSADLSSLSDEQLMQLAESRGINKGSMIGNFARGIPQGIGDALIGAVQGATDVGEAGARFIEKKIYGDNMNAQTYGDRLAQQVGQRKEQQSQLPTSERVGIEVGKIIPYLTTGTGTAKKVATATGSRIAGLVAGGAVGGVVSSALSEQEQAGLGNRAIETTKGTAIGAGTGLALGLTGKVAKGITSNGKNILAGWKARPVEAIEEFTKKPVESLEAVGQTIKDESSALYKTMRESGATIRPAATGKIFKEIDTALTDSGIMNQRLHGNTMGVLSDLKEIAKTKKGNIGIEELDQYRQLLGDVIKKDTDIAGKMGTDAFKANVAINKLDDIVEGLTPNYLVKSGNPKAVELLKEARQEWSRYRKFDNITNIVKKADGDANRMKTLMQNFINNPKNLKGFSEVEKKYLRNASRNSAGEGLLKMVGEFGFDLGSGRNSGNTAMPAFSVLFGGVPGAVGVGAATAARGAQKLSAKAKVEDVLRLIEGKQPRIALRMIQNLPPQKKELVLINLLNKGASIGLEDKEVVK